jgi:hypothetical protein
MTVSYGLFQLAGAGAGSSAQILPVPLSLLLDVALAAVAWWIADLGLGRLRLPMVVVVVVGAVMAAGIGIAVPRLASQLLHVTASLADQGGLLAAEAVLVGFACRAWFGRRARAVQLVVAWAVISWAPYLNIQLVNHPFRDLELYLRAGQRFLDGLPVYTTSHPGPVPSDPSLLPFLYPPFTLPLFAALAVLPTVVAVALWEALCVAAVVGGLRLIGVRWSFVPLLLLWPPLAIGIQVGNVACFSFLVLALAWSAGEVIPLGGAFKPQTGLVALWLVRERRLRTLAIGLVALALGILATLPLTGIAIYGEWLRGLSLFQRWIGIHPGLMGFALQHFVGLKVATAIAVAAVIVALIAVGRDGLGRMAVAATAASPTVYVHGFSLGLPSVLFLDAASVWAVLALAPWGRAFWPAIALVVVALILGLTRAGLADGDPAGSESGSLSADATRLHPLGELPVPWPDRPARQPEPIAS